MELQHRAANIPSDESPARRHEFYQLADALPQLVWICEPDGTVEYFNRRWLEYTGLSVEDCRKDGIGGVVVHPDERALAVARWLHAIHRSEPFEMEYRLRSKEDGSFRWFLSRTIPQFDEFGKVAGWIGTATDIDEQRRSHNNLAFVVEAGTVFSTSLDIETVCEQLAGLAIKHFADWCFVTLATHDEQLSTVAIAHKDAGRVRRLEQVRDRYPPARSGGIGQVLESGEPLLVEQVRPEQLEAAAQGEQHLQLLRDLQMHSVMIVPLSAGSGPPYGCVTLVSAESRRTFNRDDLEVAGLAATRAAFAIRNARVLDQEKRATQRLQLTAKASRLLFEAEDPRESFSEIVKLMVAEVADACAVALIEDGALRIGAIAHGDPTKDAVAARLRGQRVLLPDAERAIVARLASGEPYVCTALDVDRLLPFAWPYLWNDLRALGLSSAIVVPLQTRGSTHGVLIVANVRAASSYEQRDLPQFLEIAQIASTAFAAAKTLERERHIATTFQRASLPTLIPEVAGLRFDAVYSSAGDEGEVGGDWYDAFELDDGSILISVGDVTGHGLEAAIIMSKVRHFLTAIPMHERDPARIIDTAERVLAKRFPNAVVTAFVGIISLDRRTLHYAGAGHPHPLLRREGMLIELVSEGLPIGLRMLGDPQTSRKAHIEKGDLLVLYTDGLTEFDRQLLDGEARLRDVLSRDAIVHARHPAHLIANACIHGPPHDDIAVLAVTFDEPTGWSFQADDARAAEHARGAFIEYLREHTKDPALVDAGELVFGELIGNVVRHAPGPVEIHVAWNGTQPEIHVIDTGPAFEPRPELPDDTLKESGRGLFIIARAGAGARVERIPGYGNHTWATLRRAQT